MTKHFNPEFRQEVAELVVDKGYSVREAADAMSVGKSTVDRWVRDLRKERNGEETQGAPICRDTHLIIFGQGHETIFFKTWDRH
jgi:transposase